MNVREEPKNGIETIGADNNIKQLPIIIIYKKSPVLPANVSSSNRRAYRDRKNI